MAAATIAAVALVSVTSCSDDDSNAGDDGDAPSTTPGEQGPPTSGEQSPPDEGVGTDVIVIDGTRYEYEPNCFGLDDQEVEAVGGADGVGVNLYVYLDEPGGEVAGGQLEIRDGDNTGDVIWQADFGDEPETLVDVEIDGMHITGTAMVTGPASPDEPVEATFDVSC